MFAFLIAAGALLPLGLVLLFAGLCTRRVGSTPYCARCGYNLTGLYVEGQPQNCPECGRDLSEAGAVVLGERRRRLGRLIAGALILVAVTATGISIGVVHGRSFNWYTLKPTAWVLSDLRDSQSTVASRAMTELLRRDLADELSTSQQERFTMACLDFQAQSPYGVLAMSAVDWLRGRYYAGLLNGEPRIRFLRQMVRPVLNVRPRVVRGAGVPAEVTIEWCSGSARSFSPGGFDAAAQWEDVTCDGTGVLRHPLRSFDTRTRGGGAGRSTSTYHLNTLPDRPGKHVVRASFRYQIFETQPHQSTGDTRCALEKEQTLEAEYEVLSERPEDYIRLRAGAELDHSVASHVRLDVNPESAIPLFVHIDEDVAVGVAFEVVIAGEVRPNIRGHLPIAGGPGKRGWGTVIDLSTIQPPAAPQAAGVDIVLRASASVAEQTTDLFEIWDGELLFTNVRTDIGRQTYRAKLQPKSASAPATSAP